MGTRSARIVAAVSGLLLVAGCNLQPDPPSFDFGQVYVGMTAPAKSATWVNNADKAANFITATTRAPYAIVNPGTVAQQTVQPGGRTAAIQVNFTPPEARVYNEELRVVSTGVPATLLQMTGRGVWAINAGTFVLENQPPNVVGSFDFSTTPIQPNQPIDWGTRPLGNPPRDAYVQVANSGAATDKAQVRLLRGNQNFAITFPGAHDPMNLGQGANGARKITVTFTCAAVGDFWDVLEVTDGNNPANRAGIVLKARVVAGE